jgi:hypothetical protein
VPTTIVESTAVTELSTVVSSFPVTTVITQPPVTVTQGSGVVTVTVGSVSSSAQFVCLTTVPNYLHGGGMRKRAVDGFAEAMPVKVRRRRA